MMKDEKNQILSVLLCVQNVECGEEQSAECGVYVYYVELNLVEILDVRDIFRFVVRQECHSIPNVLLSVASFFERTKPLLVVCMLENMLHCVGWKLETT